MLDHPDLFDLMAAQSRPLRIPADFDASVKKGRPVEPGSVRDLRRKAREAQDLATNAKPPADTAATTVSQADDDQPGLFPGN